MNSDERDKTGENRVSRCRKFQKNISEVTGTHDEQRSCSMRDETLFFIENRKQVSQAA